MVQSVFSATDFNTVLDEYAGRNVSHIPITKTTNNQFGDEVLANGTTADIKAYFMHYNNNYDFQKEGFTEQGDAVLLSKYTDSVGLNHIISIDNKKFIVIESFNVPGVFDTAGSSTSNDIEFAYTSNNLKLLE